MNSEWNYSCHHISNLEKQFVSTLCPFFHSRYRWIGFIIHPHEYRQYLRDVYSRPWVFYSECYCMSSINWMLPGLYLTHPRRVFPLQESLLILYRSGWRKIGPTQSRNYLHLLVTQLLNEPSRPIQKRSPLPGKGFKSSPIVFWIHFPSFVLNNSTSKRFFKKSEIAPFTRQTMFVWSVE